MEALRAGKRSQLVVHRKLSLGTSSTTGQTRHTHLQTMGGRAPEETRYQLCIHEASPAPLTLHARQYQCSIPTAGW
jgi:hypothetical protein